MPKVYDINYFKIFANNKNGKCLSNEYKSLNTKLKWECSEGHSWEAIPNSILRGTWCRVCSGKDKKTIKNMQDLAFSRGGKCLSINYTNSRTKLIWECSNGHVWSAKADNIVQGKWCPDCSTGLSERICRTYFEQIFKLEFPNTRSLDWLRNEHGNFLELDGYNKSLKLAFEHQGSQHYDGESYFEKAKYDLIKQELCLKNNILLIQIPQLGVILPHSDFHKFLEEKFKNTLFENYEFPPLNKVDLRKAYIHRMDLEMKQLAEKFGGEFLSLNYYGSLIKHKWRCSSGHLWETTPSVIKRGSWCPHCGILSSAKKRRKSDFKVLHAIIKSKDGFCLSKEYIDSNTRIIVRCSYGHTWKALPSNLKKGSWCPKCAKQEKISINHMHELAKLKNGFCLSNDYINSNSLLMWRCKLGHEWMAPASRIKAGSWCLKCSGSEKLNLNTFQNIANSRGGKCLSLKYINANSKLEWECSEGHIWFARANHVKMGSWCPFCIKSARTSKLALGIEVMNKLAEQLNGKCISTKYVNNKSKLIWECDLGHIFERTYTEIKKGRWCDKCIK